MSLREIIGYFLLLLPFLIVCGVIVKFIGWQPLIIIIIVFIFVVACLYGGVYLIKGGL